jgi:hypothetical protein
MSIVSSVVALVPVPLPYSDSEDETTDARLGKLEASVVTWPLSSPQG